MHDVAFPVCAGLQAQLKDPSVLLQKALASQLWTLVANSLKRRALGFSVFRVWLFFRLVFWSVLHWKTSVFRFCCPLWFPVFPFFSILFFGFLAKIKQVRFLLGSPCSQMLGYLYVSILQSAQRDSCKRELLAKADFPHCPLLLFNRGSLWILLDDPKADMPVLRP